MTFASHRELIAMSRNRSIGTNATRLRFEARSGRSAVPDTSISLLQLGTNPRDTILGDGSDHCMLCAFVWVLMGKLALPDLKACKSSVNLTTVKFSARKYPYFVIGGRGEH